MKFIMIFGPQAVGKMSIGESLSEKTGLPLLFNHVTLDVIWPYIGWNRTTFELSEQLRFGIFKHISEDEQHEGIIFTFVWAFDLESDWEYIQRIKDLFSQPHQKIYFVELEADLEERLRRNKTENRLSKKPSKRNIEHSEQELRASFKKHRLNSFPKEIQETHYLRLDVTKLSTDESSQIILDWINEIELGD